jgi:hypothetical protein
MTEKRINTSNKEVKEKEVVVKDEPITKEDVFIDSKTAKPINKVDNTALNNLIDLVRDIRTKTLTDINSFTLPEEILNYPISEEKINQLKNLFNSFL